ncbi:MAG: rhomboid family intramembrane serine protease, partial [Nanoarchaeota archaeon]
TTGDYGALANLFGVKSAVGGNLLQGVQWAGIAYFVVPMIANALGLQDSTTKALQYAVPAGLFAYNAAQALGQSGSGIAQSSVGSWIGGHAAIFGIGVGVIVFVLMYKKVSYDRVDFSCNPWQAPIGGDDCEKCNDGMNPCSEYRCKSLGQACGIVNKGTTDEKCVWLNPRDVTSPIIKVREDALKIESTNKLTCDYTNLAQRPSGGGTSIECKETKNNCLPAFTPFEFGIQTNKPSQCKVDFKLTKGYEEMAYYFGESNLFDYNHTQRLNIPNKRAVEALAQSQNDSLDGETGIFIENNNQYDLYIRCTSANGYYNPDPFVVSFCVDDGPDATPPQIVETSIRNNQPVQFEVNEVPIIVYTNEPASCKWSRTDQQYDKMENDMQCTKSIVDMDANLLYPCKGTLTGLQDRKDNVYYFRCEDQPWAKEDERISMQTSYKLTLKGTQPLNIKEDSIKPKANEIVTGATSSVEVNLALETENGYDAGKAECYYSNDNKNFVPMLQTNSFEHNQRQDLAQGSYTYYFKCVDLGGNTALGQTSFEVFVDTFAPMVVRVLNDASRLKIITDEDASCYYSTNENTKCNYEISNNSIAQLMPHEIQDDKKEHFAAWDIKSNYYIKCKDINDKQPAPTQCSIIVKPEDLAEEE